MIFRLADMNDLSALKIMYREIVENMNLHHIEIWDDIYPVEFIREDIENHQFYVLLDNNQIVAGLSLCENHDGESDIEWLGKNEKVLYIDRLGVRVNYLRKGVGALILNEAINLARKMDIQCLRLFVVDTNEPAINLYKKVGFIEAKGTYNEVIDELLTLHEQGFEILL